MNLEIGIKRRLSYLFVALAVLLIGALVYSNAEVQYARKMALAVSTHNVFERILSEAIKTNDVPELSRLLKRSVSQDRIFFAYEESSDQMVLPSYAQIDEFRGVLKKTARCLSHLTTVEFNGRSRELFCNQLTAESSPHRFVLYQLMPAEPIAPARFIWISLGVALVILFILWSALSKIMNDQLFRPIEELERHIGTQLNDAEPVAAPSPAAGPEEIRRLRTTFDDLLARAKASFKLEKMILESETKERIARQVAHDIRSPLSALNMVFARFDQLGDEGRALAKKAVQRINDIANDLLRGSQQDRAAEVAEALPVLLESEIDGVVSETRAAFANRRGLDIVFEQRTYPRTFVTLRPIELRRALSNLIINSIEALDEAGGSVVIKIEAAAEGGVAVTVTDDGVGIAPDRLPLVGREGYSFGKSGASGSGLGVSYAMDFARRTGGRIEYQSTLGKGTKVTMTLPTAPRPAWYLETLELKAGGTIVALDDDQSVHQMWRNAFAAHPEARVHLVCVSSGAELKSWLNAHPERARQALYLIDFELAAGEPTGLDVIEALSLSRRSVLVTSRFDEAEILRRCLRIGVRQIPKVAAGLIPIVLRT